MSEKNVLVPTLPIENKIYVFRGQKVMVDNDLAILYGVKTKRLNEQVKRNIERFPEEFMFQLTKKEFELLKSKNASSNLKSQNATASWGGRRILPYMFTEHGTVMLASVLKSTTAVEASIQIVKAFVKFREIISSQVALAQKLDELENKYDDKFKKVFYAIRHLMTQQPHVATLKKGRKD